jgi:anthranilate phosphoribosyltransferase
VVGTGGDSHNTFNISTTSSIIASSLLLIAKHGNRASTSKSGSADLLMNAKPVAPILDNVNPSTLPFIYSKSNYAFLFAPIFHPGMRYVAPVRKELGWRTIFNLLGPLSNPLDDGPRSPSGKPTPFLEARLLGVASRNIGPNFAQSLVLSGVRKAMVVCGDEELDELSCAGPTHCWKLVETPNTDSNPLGTSAGDAPESSIVHVEYFLLRPADFGFPEHPLSMVGPGKQPQENADIFMRILSGELPDHDPLMHFILINTAALFVVSGICDADSSSLGHGDDGNVIKERGPGGGRWKEGVRRARWAIKSGAALREWTNFVESTKAV